MEESSISFQVKKYINRKISKGTLLLNKEGYQFISVNGYLERRKVFWKSTTYQLGKEDISTFFFIKKISTYISITDGNEVNEKFYINNADQKRITDFIENITGVIERDLARIDRSGECQVREVTKQENATKVSEEKAKEEVSSDKKDDGNSVVREEYSNFRKAIQQRDEKEEEERLSFEKIKHESVTEEEKVELLRFRSAIRLRDEKEEKERLAYEKAKKEELAKKQQEEQECGKTTKKEYENSSYDTAESAEELLKAVEKEKAKYQIQKQENYSLDEIPTFTESEIRILDEDYSYTRFKDYIIDLCEGYFICDNDQIVVSALDFLAVYILADYDKKFINEIEKAYNLLFTEVNTRVNNTIISDQISLMVEESYDQHLNVVKMTDLLIIAIEESVRDTLSNQLFWREDINGDQSNSYLHLEYTFPIFVHKYFERSYDLNFDKEEAYQGKVNRVWNYIKQQKGVVSIAEIRSNVCPCSQETIKGVLSKGGILDYHQAYISTENISFSKEELNTWDDNIRQQLLEHGICHINQIYDTEKDKFSYFLGRAAINSSERLYSVIDYLFHDIYNFRYPYISNKNTIIEAPEIRLRKYALQKDEITVSDILQYSRTNYLYLENILRFLNSLNDRMLFLNRSSLVSIDKLGVSKMTATEIGLLIHEELRDRNVNTIAIRDLQCISNFPVISEAWDEWLIYSMLLKWSNIVHVCVTNTKFSLAIPVVSTKENGDQSEIAKIAQKYQGQIDHTLTRKVDNLDNLDELIEDYIELEDVDDFDEEDGI